MREKPTKVTLDSARRILNILYPSLIKHAGQNNAFIRQNLTKKYGLKNLKDLKPLESFDNYHKKPITEAVRLLPERSVESLSNVLYFRTRNQLLHSTDFTRITPFDQSSFDLSTFKKNDLDLSAVLAREPHNLVQRGGYYLLFKNVELASAYLIDSIGKQLNGVNLYLSMIDPHQHQKYIQQDLLGESSEIDENILALKIIKPRNHRVVIKGFPTFITEDTIRKMLWDYNLDYNYEHIKLLDSDKRAGIGMWLLTFEDKLEAQRFARNYNGKHFNNEERLPKLFASVLS